MTGQRTFVTFDADLPDETVFSETGEISVPGGRNVCEKLAQQIRLQGGSVSEPKQHEFYGWELTAEFGGHETWMLLQGGEPWLLIVEDRSGKLGWLRKAREPSAETLRSLDDALKACANFRSVTWFTRQEYESGMRAGNPAP